MPTFQLDRKLRRISLEENPDEIKKIINIIGWYYYLFSND